MRAPLRGCCVTAAASQKGGNASDAPNPSPTNLHLLARAGNAPGEPVGRGESLNMRLRARPPEVAAEDSDDGLPRRLRKRKVQHHRSGSAGVWPPTWPTLVRFQLLSSLLTKMRAEITC